MKKAKAYGQGPVVGTSYGSILLILGFAAFIGIACYWANDRIHSIHRELFNAEAPVIYDVDFGNMLVIAKTKIVSQPRPGMNQWKELPFMSQSQTYRITHKIGIGSHTGTIELKVGDNAKNAEFLSTDIIVDFVVSTGEVSMDVKPFEYAAPDFKLVFSDLSGNFSMNGDLRLRVKNLELKMVNYLFRLSDVSLDVPENRKSINILASNIKFDEVNLGHSKIVFMGTNPFEIKLQSTYKNEPVEIHWNIEKSTIQGEDVHIGFGKLSFPVDLLNAYVDPNINRQLLAQEQQATSSGSEKARFMFSVAKDVRRAEARALALRAIASFKHIKREDNVYQIRIEKQDAFVAAEERAKKSAERKALLESWKSMPVEKMYEVAFYTATFGDENHFLAVKELLEGLKEKASSSPLYQALKLRSDFRDAKIGDDEYDQYKSDQITKRVQEVTSVISEQKLATLLWIEFARVKGDNRMILKQIERFKTQETNPEIAALIGSMKYAHMENAKAIDLLVKTREQHPEGMYVPNFSRELIHIYHHTGNKEKLEDELKVLLSKQRPSTEDLLSYAKLLEDKKELTHSLAAVDKCIDLNPVHKGCQEQKEKVMSAFANEMQKENTDNAIKYLEELIADRPASIPANSGLGSLYKIKGDQKKSIHHYSIACALGSSFACIEAGDTLTRNEDEEKAFLLYDISCDLKSGTGCAKAGKIIEKIGKAENAGGFYERSCNEYQDNEGCYHLARALRSKNAPNRSIAAYLSKACKVFNNACKLANVYQRSNKQPEIPFEPK